MRILITGNKGFIGSNLEKKLKAKQIKFEVSGVDKKSGKNINNESTFGRIEKVDIIVHLAATCSTSKSLSDPKGDFINNALGTLNVLEFARKINSPIIYSSSCKVKPASSANRAPYGLSKYVGELYIHEYNKDYGISFVINRFGTVYGEGQEGSPESGWLSWFVKAAHLNLPITIYGTGKQVRDVLYVDDATDLIVDQIENFNLYKNRTYNVGGGSKNAITLLQALKFLNYDNFLFDKRRVADVFRFVSDNKMVSKVNGWKPKTSWVQGFNKTKLWYQNKAKR